MRSGVSVPRIRFRLTPQTNEFFELYEQGAANLSAQSRLLLDMLSAYPERKVLQREIKDHEHAGDRITHELGRLINQTFIAPFDRDDIYRLAGAIDDICDAIDEAADLVVLYGVEEITEDAVRLAEVIVRATAKLEEALGFLNRLDRIGDLLVQIHELEDDADRIHRNAVAALFRQPDPFHMARWKDIYADLELAVDGCEHAAGVLEAISLKNR